MLKLAVVAVVIAVGVFYVKPENWHPFAPNGIGGVLKGVSAVFFAYIGFDAISTTAEECNNPQRDLPKAMMWALIICTVLYVIITLVLTGMVPYTELGVGDPLSFVFAKVGLPRFSGLVAVSAVFAMASVLLVFQLGQPRIWLTMSARWPPTPRICPHPPQVPHAVVQHHRHGYFRGRAGPGAEHGFGGGSDEHRHAVRLRAGLRRHPHHRPLRQVRCPLHGALHQRALADTGAAGSSRLPALALRPRHHREAHRGHRRHHRPPHPRGLLRHLPPPDSLPGIYPRLAGHHGRHVPKEALAVAGAGPAHQPVFNDAIGHQ
ncbi:MAG: APC family permease [Hymenobacter sp.]